MKAASIVGVVCHHLANRRFDPDTLDLIRQIARLFSWCVFAFIAASGWLHAQSELKESKGVWLFVLQRGRRILVPYVLLTLVYAIVWQLVQDVVGFRLGDRLPVSLGEKVVQSLFQTGNSVGEQLYFLPVLFALSALTQVVWRWRGWIPVGALGLGGMVVGILLFPEGGNTGMNSGVLSFGAFCYSAGFLSRVTLGSSYQWSVAGVLSVVLVACLGWGGVPKVVPLLAMVALPTLERFRLPLLATVGQASGTVFAYHTPFILQPLVLICTRLEGWYQMVVLYAVALSVIGALTWAHGRLKSTRLKFLLL